MIVSPNSVIHQPGGRFWHRLAGGLFGRKPVTQKVETSAHFSASPEELWGRLCFYEDIPGRPPLLLRLALPYPVRTEGGKVYSGATVKCTYRKGEMTKCTTAVVPPRSLEFEVTEQRLGIENCIRALSGSYEVRQRDDGAEIVLTTVYLAYLRPRLLWLPVEKFLAHSLHRHILGGIRTSLPRPRVVTGEAAAERAVAESNVSGGRACSTASLSSRR